jgi:hypothetical protein
MPVIQESARIAMTKVMRRLTQDRLAHYVFAAAPVGVFCITFSGYSQAEFILDNKQFDEWIYGKVPGIDEDSDIARAIKEGDSACRLSDNQKNKLRSAGKREYARFSSAV